MTEEKLIQERKHVIKLQSTIDDMKLEADAQDVEQPVGDANEVVTKLRTGAEADAKDAVAELRERVTMTEEKLKQEQKRKTRDQTPGYYRRYEGKAGEQEAGCEAG